jgi:Domain of unknown function (DUF5664)
MSSPLNLFTASANFRQAIFEVSQELYNETGVRAETGTFTIAAVQGTVFEQCSRFMVHGIHFELVVGERGYVKLRGTNRNFAYGFFWPKDVTDGQATQADVVTPVGATRVGNVDTAGGGQRDGGDRTGEGSHPVHPVQSGVQSRMPNGKRKGVDQQVRKRAHASRSAKSEAGDRASDGGGTSTDETLASACDDFWSADAPDTNADTFGVKYDDGKLAYNLVDAEAEAEFVAVLTYGANKYKPGNWAYVHDAQNRYYAAVRRHMELFRAGETFDAESGLHHMAHAAACIHFILALSLSVAPSDKLETRLANAVAIVRKLRGKNEQRK